MCSLLLVGLLLLVAPPAIYGLRLPPSSDCLTADSQRGSCSRLQACPMLWDLLVPTKTVNSSYKSVNESEQVHFTLVVSVQSLRFADPGIVAYISRSQCSTRGVAPTYCCPRSLPIIAPTEAPKVVTQPSIDLKFGVPHSLSELHELMLRVDQHPNRALLPKKCGDNGPSDLIAGGAMTGITEFPWLARLEYQTQRGREVRCGGVLVSDRYVLTAAHCLTSSADSRLETVILGEYNTLSDPDCLDTLTGKYCADPLLRVRVESSVVHPKFATSLDKHGDIGLVRLEKSVKFTGYIRPICMPRGAQLLAKHVGSLHVVAGWGASGKSKYGNMKRMVSLPVMSNSQCQNVYKSISLNLDDSQLCAGGQQGRDACSGDNGGPLMAAQNISWHVTGVVSLGPRQCGLEGHPGVYTRVAPFMGWILDTMRP